MVFDRSFVFALFVLNYLDAHLLYLLLLIDRGYHHIDKEFELTHPKSNLGLRLGCSCLPMCRYTHN